MRRKPAIIIFALLLFLSIGGAVFHHQLNKERPPEFREVDAFLRALPASSGRVLQFHQSFPGREQRNRGWWDMLRIRRMDYVLIDAYYIGKTGHGDAVSTFGADTGDLLEWLTSHVEEFKKGDATLVICTRKNGKIERVGVTGAPDAADFIYTGLPKLRPYVILYSPP